MVSCKTAKFHIIFILIQKQPEFLISIEESHTFAIYKQSSIASNAEYIEAKDNQHYNLCNKVRISLTQIYH